MSDGVKEGLGSAVSEIIRSGAVPPAKIIGSWLAELLAMKYSQWRVKQAAKIVEGAGEILAELNLEPAICKPKVLIPLIEQASLEENEDLVRKWMGLLASAVTKDSVHPSYSKILSEIIPIEAKIIDYLYSLEIDLEECKDDKSNNGRMKRFEINRHFRLNTLKEAVSCDDEAFIRSIDNLLRVRLCKHPENQDTYEVVVNTSLDDNDLDVDTEMITNHYTDMDSIRLTNLGKDFVKACRGPFIFFNPFKSNYCCGDLFSAAI